MKPESVCNKDVSEEAMVELLREIAKAFISMKFEGEEDESDLPDLPQGISCKPFEG